MTIAEVEEVVNNYNLSYKNTWNQIRFLAYINANCAGNNLKKPEDLLLFSWEKTEDSNENREDIETTKLKLLEILKTV